MNLQQLFQGIDSTVVQGKLDRQIRQLAYDSRQVQGGDVYFCLPGTRTDGHQFLAGAAANGACAAVVSRAWAGTEQQPLPADLTIIQVDDVQWALALASRTFFGGGRGEQRLIGVTGTNGKTTTTHLIEAILQHANRAPGLIGTLHYRFGQTELPAPFTTPQAVEMQELLNQMRQNDVRNVVMEVSSIALEQRRVLAEDFDAAVLTNITQDHLDYHKTFDQYRAAKAMLFAGLTPEHERLRYAVLNADDPACEEFRALCRVPVIAYGLNSRTATVWAEDVHFDLQGLSLTIHTPAGALELRLQLTGAFNVYNTLAAVAVAVQEGIPLKICKTALEAVPGIPGRIERITVPGVPFQVLVDYAHTPDSLENILTSARPLTDRRLIAVFGCGGDRDRLKRPIMGGIAARLADTVVVTSDNPRSEEPAAIIEEIMAGIPAPQRDMVHVDVDRRAAIGWAIRQAQPGDAVVIAGKGHETYQIFRDRTIHFDDREVAREFLEGMASAVK